jgi:2-amino-4-hydroxy-6-hydroxymethyldihydropteridine diphosphokinase
VPHPRLHERAFALKPLLDLDPELEIPGRGRVAALLSKLQSG